MKKLLFAVAILGIVMLNSCMQTNTQNDIAPQIQYASNPTLNGVAITNLDTLTVGDTLLLPLALYGYYNPLASLKVTNDTAVSNISFPGISALGSTILSNDSTNLADGYIYFGAGTFSTVQLVLQYVPTKPSTTATLKFILSSTSTYSPATAQLSLPAKAKS